MIPCGIDDKSVTSIEKELGKKVDFDEVKSLFLDAFLEEFKAQLIS